MKITIYTVPECQFSKAEKEYLAAHNLQFEEKNLETNKEFLTEMLTISNNFAGTPVTKIEKEDGKISILKGFTKEEFDEVLGYSQPKEAVVNSTIDIPTTPKQQPSTPQPVSSPPSPQKPTSTTQSDSVSPPSEPSAPTSSQPTPPPPPPVQNTTVQSPTSPTSFPPTQGSTGQNESISSTSTTPEETSDQSSAALNSVLENLQTKAQAGQTSTESPSPADSANLPHVPEPDFK